MKSTQNPHSKAIRMPLIPQSHGTPLLPTQIKEFYNKIET